MNKNILKRLERAEEKEREAAGLMTRMKLQKLLAACPELRREILNRRPQKQERGGFD